MLVLDINVWGYLVGPFCRDVSNGTRKKGSYGRAKALGGGQVHEDPVVVTQYMKVEGFIPDQLYATKDGFVHQDVIND